LSILSTCSETPALLPVAAMEPEGRNDSLKDITQEEVSKLTRAMKDTQFQSHMDDYCKEISDPAHRKEYLQYLDQLEAKGEIPEGQCLLRTEPGCCVKTTIKFKTGQNQKCFINIVHCDQLNDMEELPDATGGKRVHVPYSLSPPRPERDNKDENCMTCDFAVSTWTFGQALQRPQILKMLVDTASDGLGSQFLKGHEEVKKDFKVMRRIRCRGPGHRPLPMSVKAELLKDKGKKNKNGSALLSKDAQSAVTPSELREMRKEAKDKQLKPPKPTDDDEVEEVPRKFEDEEPSYTAGGALRIRVPKHKLIHSGEYNLTDFMQASNRPTMLAQSIPRVLKLVVDLPSVKKVSDISLDVTAFNVCIEVPDKYYLDLPLSYEIDAEKGDAKFDKVKQVLTLELPVKLVAPDPSLIANRHGFASGDVEELDDGALSEGENEDELPPLEDPPAQAEQDAEEPSPTPESLSSPSQQAPSEVPQCAPPAEPDYVPEEELAPFIASASFTGKKPGYYFGNGDVGLGFYRDARQKRPLREGAEQEGLAPKEPAGFADGSSMDSPLVEEVGEFDFISASSPVQAAPKRATLSHKTQQYIQTSSQLTSPLVASDIDAPHGETELPLDCHQTRQNLVLLVGVPLGHEVAGLQLAFANRRLTITFCTRESGSDRWCRHLLRRVLCRGVDISQWHADAPKASAGADSEEAQVVITLRKIEQERWPEVFDTSAAAVVAEREPISSNDVVDSEPLIAFADNTAAADTAAGTDVDVVDDSAELDIATPAGTPVVLGPANGGKGVAAKAGTATPWNASAASAAAQSACVMGQAVLLRTRLMYQLF